MASHTFIEREISALRGHGAQVITTSVRYPEARHLIGAEEHAAVAETFYILRSARNPGVVLQAFAHILGSPRRAASTAALAIRTARPGIKGALWQGFYLLEAAILARHLKRRRVRHLHNHFADSSCTVSMLTSRLSGIPFSFTLHGPSDLFEPRSWHLSEKIAQADFVSCISYFARSQAMLFSHPKYWPKLKVVHCGVVPEKYESPASAAGIGLRLLFVGRLDRVKGLRVLFEAYEKARTLYPELSLTLIGDGPERAHAEREAARIGGISLMGYQSQDAVAAAFGCADVLVLPSFAEGVPVVLMEAMAAGLPVIATRVGGVSELVDDRVSGILTPPGNADALYDAIVAMTGDPSGRQKMGAIGRAKVRAEFDVRVEATRLLSLFRGGGGTALRPEPANSFRMEP
jgi:glycosyltransferase involved in cell wall biosynthesis